MVDANYERYIKSKTWMAVRERAFKKYGRVCAGCGSKDRLHVHHKTYERFKKEPLTDLVVVCETCHSIIHDFHRNRNANKLTLWRVTELVLIQLRAENGRSNAPAGWVPANQRGYVDPLARHNRPAPTADPKDFEERRTKGGRSYVVKKKPKKKSKARRNKGR